MKETDGTPRPVITGAATKKKKSGPVSRGRDRITEGEKVARRGLNLGFEEVKGMFRSPLLLIIG